MTLPGGKVLTVVLRIGDSELHVSSEFPQAGILSPASIGGTATVLQIQTDDAGGCGGHVMSARKSATSSLISFGASAMGS